MAELPSKDNGGKDLVDFIPKFLDTLGIISDNDKTVKEKELDLRQAESQNNLEYSLKVLESNERGEIRNLFLSIFLIIVFLTILGIGIYFVIDGKTEIGSSMITGVITFIAGLGIGRDSRKSSSD
ncbi:hypothetical protein AB3N62_06945 [Leptospira sp. WS4.C2]